MPVTENRDPQILAHELVLRMLVSKEKMDDPQFQAKSILFLDRFLGGMAAGPRDKELDELLVGARAKFVELTRTRDDIFLDTEAGSKPLSWKRRFLNWLERG